MYVWLVGLDTQTYSTERSTCDLCVCLVAIEALFVTKKTLKNVLCQLIVSIHWPTATLAEHTHTE